MNTPSPAMRAGSPILWQGDPGGLRRRGSDKPGEILRLLSRAWRNAALYGTKHSVVLRTMDDLHQFLQKPLSGRPSLRLFIHEDTFFVENTLLLEESLQLNSLLRAFKQREIYAIQLDAGVEPGELKHLIGVLNLKVEEVRQLGGARAYLGQQGVRHITVGFAAGAGTGLGVGSKGKPGPLDAGGTGGQVGAGGQAGEGSPLARPEQAPSVKVDPQDAYQAGLRVMDELNYQASTNLPLNLWKARVVVNYFIDLIHADSAALLGVATLKNYDEDTYHHSVNVCMLSLLIGSHLNLDRTLLITLGLAGLLHDIGKVRVPREILAKPAELTHEEQEIVRRHTVHGAHILRELRDLSWLAMVVAFEHHANYNLSGYPQITAKKVPHPLTRIVWVADCFDAMTSSRRAYRKPKSPGEALKVILEGAGTLFDPVLARLSVQVLAGLSREVSRRIRDSRPRN